ncbi:hypothetical protein AN958_10304 [Leucoagaricus sp. SymC.cos]|nr:hypothetical protein AN958_10304 [Leucoagaricus sp. SymC.cos]
MSMHRPQISPSSLRPGIASTLASQTTPNVGGDQIDTSLVKYFSTECTKKTSISLTILQQPKLKINAPKQNPDLPWNILNLPSVHHQV